MIEKNSKVFYGSKKAVKLAKNCEKIPRYMYILGELDGKSVLLEFTYYLSTYFDPLEKGQNLNTLKFKIK